LLNQHDGTFLLGEKLSIGDLGVAPFVGRIFAAGKYGTLAFPCPRSLSFLSIFFPPVSLRVVLTFSFLLRSTGLQVSSPTPSKKLSPLPPSPPSERTTTPWLPDLLGPCVTSLSFPSSRADADSSPREQATFDPEIGIVALRKRIDEMRKEGKLWRHELAEVWELKKCQSTTRRLRLGVVGWAVPIRNEVVLLFLSFLSFLCLFTSTLSTLQS
jgi:hypothetical protein